MGFYVEIAGCRDGNVEISGMDGGGGVGWRWAWMVEGECWGIGAGNVFVSRW